MLTKRIIACLDVKNNKVVKGVKFKNHVILGDILEIAQTYSLQGADELVFYDITASTENRTADRKWIEKIAARINIPFCVAGGIRSIEDAKAILGSGADKISINSPAIENPYLIDQMAHAFGTQCIVVGIDSRQEKGDYFCWQYTGSATHAKNAHIKTIDWVIEAQSRGAGEIVLNCMAQDGTKSGFDIAQTKVIRSVCNIPLIASGGAGNPQDFQNVFLEAQVDGALAAGIFHRNEYTVHTIKCSLKDKGIEVRL